MLQTLVYRGAKFAAHNPPADSLAALRTEPGVMLWIDLSAPTPEEISLVLERLFAFHPLVIEDCVSDTPLPKIEEYEDYLHLVMHAVDYTRTEKFTTTELELILGKTFLVTFHRQPLRPVQAAIERHLRNPGTPVRGPDRFAHTILDFMVEAYKPALDELRHELEVIGEDVLRPTPTTDLFPRVVGLRKELSTLRRITRPQREVATALAQRQNPFIRPVIVPYLRDLQEELARIEEQAVAWSEQLILSFRVYLNKSSHEANESIRVLTALTALTLPAFVVGSWFGMNFHAMYEVRTSYGYWLAFAVTVVGTLGMLLFLRKNRWL
jgi:magnesium transporter